MKKTLSVGAIAASIVISAACAANPPAAPTFTQDNGTPFLPQYIHDLQTPPAPTTQPTSWTELMLPPKAKP